MLIRIVWGKKLFGRIEKVPGFFYVATEFFHIWYCPLIPERTVVVVREDQNGWQGSRTAFSLKSILLSWTLPILLLTWTFGGTIAIVLWTDMHTELQDKIVSGVIFVGAFLLWLLLLIIPQRIRPKHARALELAKILQLNPESLAALKALYER